MKKSVLIGSVLAGAMIATSAQAIVDADLSVTLTGSPNPVAAGGTLTHTLTVTNNGVGDADGTSVILGLPSGVSFTALTRAPGCTCTTPAVGATGNISCSGLVLDGDTATFTIVSTVQNSTSVGTILSISTTVSSALADPNPSNNTATAISTVTAAAPTIPTLSEWAMILLGTMLAGGAALHLQGRRKAA